MAHIQTHVFCIKCEIHHTPESKDVKICDIPNLYQFIPLGVCRTVFHHENALYPNSHNIKPLSLLLTLHDVGLKMFGLF